MCTVSFVFARNNFIITSNRDEHITRPGAAAPDFKMAGEKKIIFPKDAKAGGTWFAAASDGTVAVLLNGAFVKHTAKPPYRKSRGLILLEVVEAVNSYAHFKEVDLLQIEPFTIILYQAGNLYELRWDGENKYEKQLQSNENHIWSSATLYAADVIEERENKFKKFISSHPELTAALIHDFHNSNQGDEENGFIINRDTGMKTFSITQAVINNNALEFIHHDLLHDKSYKDMLDIKTLHQ